MDALKNFNQNPIISSLISLSLPKIHNFGFVFKAILVGKSRFVSHTKHTTEATNMDLFHS